MKRSLLRAIARGLVGAVLAAQMAISAYACPALSLRPAAHLALPDAGVATGESETAKTNLPMVQPSNCEAMMGGLDASSPNLCAEHCKYGQQTDHVPTLNAPAFVLTAWYVMPLVPMLAPPPRPAAATLRALAAVDPPHAILHCVHRI